MAETGEIIDIDKALDLCKKYKLKITKTGLYYIGGRYGFVEKDENNNIYFKKKDLLKYIKESLKPIPNEWISVKEAAKLRSITVGYIYRLIKDNKIKCKTLGRKRINYILKEEIKKYGKE